MDEAGRGSMSWEEAKREKELFPNGMGKSGEARRREPQFVCTICKHTIYLVADMHLRSFFMLGSVR